MDSFSQGASYFGMNLGGHCQCDRDCICDVNTDYPGYIPGDVAEAKAKAEAKAAAKKAEEEEELEEEEEDLEEELDEMEKEGMASPAAALKARGLMTVTNYAKKIYAQSWKEKLAATPLANHVHRRHDRDCNCENCNRMRGAGADEDDTDEAEEMIEEGDEEEEELEDIAEAEDMMPSGAVTNSNSLARRTLPMGDFIALDKAMQSTDPHNNVYEAVISRVRDELPSTRERKLFDENLDHDTLRGYYNEIVGTASLHENLGGKWGDFKRKVKGWWTRVKDAVRGKHRAVTGSNAALDFLAHRNKLTAFASPAPSTGSEPLQAIRLRQKARSYLGPIPMYASHALSASQTQLFEVGGKAQGGIKSPMLDSLLKRIDEKKGSGDPILGKGVVGLDIQRRPLAISRTMNKVFSEEILKKKSVSVRIAKQRLGDKEYEIMEYDAPLAANGIKEKFFKSGVDNHHLEVRLAENSVIMVTPQVLPQKTAAALQSNIFYTAFGVNDGVPEIIFRFRNSGKDLSQVYVVRQLDGPSPSLSLESLNFASFEFQCECDKKTDMCTQMPIGASGTAASTGLEASLFKNLLGMKNKAETMRVFIAGSDMGGALSPLLEKLATKGGSSIGELFPTSFDQSLSAPGPESRIILDVNEGRVPHSIINNRKGIPPKRFVPKRDSGDLQALSAFTIWEYSMNMARAEAKKEQLIHSNKNESGKYLGRQLDIKLGDFAFYVRPDIDTDDAQAASVKSRVWFTIRDSPILIMRFSPDDRLTHMYVVTRREDVVGLFANLVAKVTQNELQQRAAETALASITDERKTQDDVRLRVAAILASLIVSCNFKTPSTNIKLFTPLASPSSSTNAKAPQSPATSSNGPTADVFRSIFSKLAIESGSLIKGKGPEQDAKLVAALSKSIQSTLLARPDNVASLLSQMTHSCCSIFGRNDGASRLQVLWEDRGAALKTFY